MKTYRKNIGVSLLCISGFSFFLLFGAIEVAGDWRVANRESSGLAPLAKKTPEAVVQVYAARAFGWRGKFAVHTWISTKLEGADDYTVYQVLGWHSFKGGTALQIQKDIPDRYWFDAKPKILSDLRGKNATKAIKQIKEAVRDYPYHKTYTTWPGPNSNTFTAYISRRVPTLNVDLPPTAIGKDYLPNGSITGRAPSGTGYQVSILGALGIIVSGKEGLEFNILGLSFGIDIDDLGVRLPCVGKVSFR